MNRYVAAHRAELPAWMPEITAADVLASTRAGAANALGGAALVRRLREKYEGHTARVDERTEWTEAPGSNAFALGGLADDDRQADPARQSAPAVVLALLGSARPRARDDRFLRLDACGIPVLRAGFNDRLGFVTTNNAPDLDDVFALTMDPQQADHYLFDGGSMPLLRREVAVQVRNSDGSMRAESRTFWSSHIGADHPPDAGPRVRREVDASRRVPVFRRLLRPQQGAHARRVDAPRCDSNFVPTSNFTYADADGNILYYWNGARPGADGRTAIIVSTSRPGRRPISGRGCIDVDDFPRLLNPPGGYIQNANNPPRFVSLRDPIDMSRFPGAVRARRRSGLRPQLALDLLEADDVLSVEDVIDLKYSTRMLLAERVKRDVVDACSRC